MAPPRIQTFCNDQGDDLSDELSPKAASQTRQLKLGVSQSIHPTVQPHWYSLPHMLGLPPGGVNGLSMQTLNPNVESLNLQIETCKARRGRVPALIAKLQGSKLLTILRAIRCCHWRLYLTTLEIQA